MVLHLGAGAMDFVVWDLGIKNEVPGPIRHLEVEGRGKYDDVTISETVLLLDFGAMDSLVWVLSSVSVWPGRTVFEVLMVYFGAGGMRTD